MKKEPTKASQIFSGLIAAEAAIYEELASLVGEDAKKAVETIRQHSYISATCGLLVITPGADILAFLANTWTMYARINSALGISLSKNILKSVASAIGTNVLSVIPGMILGSVGGSILKMFPVLGTAGGMVVTGATFYAISTVMGWTYLKAITFLVSSNAPINEENLKVATKQVTKDKDFIRDIYNSAKSDFKEEQEDSDHTGDS
ncbi:hypothetical protein [Nostoc sp. MG11]|uniref:hypothetical protein n=1 Tax=Nostoc sp. MG11 TaxID=2721166 RepID=UPI0018669B37|nr:hypothetical protein [Nostoc sp. MG11]